MHIKLKDQTGAKEFFDEVGRKRSNRVDYLEATPVTYWYLQDTHRNAVGLSYQKGNYAKCYEHYTGIKLKTSSSKF